MLIDAWRAVGLDGLAQVDLDEHRNPHQPLAELEPMARTVLATIARAARRPTAASQDALRGPGANVRRWPRSRRPRERAAAGAAPAGRSRCLYLDLDGTLLGRGASLLHDGEGNVTLDGVRAIQACLRADVEVVLMSGRRQAQVAEDARLFGQSAFIYEAGACLVLDGEEHWLTGAMVPGELTIAEQIEQTGAPALLLETYAGASSTTSRGTLNREVSHLFRGLVDAAEADELLAGARATTELRLVDNGVVNRRSPDLAALPHVRGYHLVPKGASKAAAVALHMQIRGYAPEQTFAVGDSREDLACAAHVGTFWLVANAVDARPLDARGDRRHRERARRRGRPRRRASTRPSSAR